MGMRRGVRFFHARPSECKSSRIIHGIPVVYSYLPASIVDCPTSIQEVFHHHLAGSPAGNWNDPLCPEVYLLLLMGKVQSNG